MTAVRRNRVVLSGRRDAAAVVLVHGYGVDQTAWSRVLPFFERHFRVLRYDLTGLGHSDLSAYEQERHGSLHGHAEDLREICREVGVRDAVMVGHSAGGMIGLLAGLLEPGLFQKQVLVSASPHYLNEVGYAGGFARADAEQVIQAVASDYVAWVKSVVPMAVGDDPERSTTEQVIEYYAQVAPPIAVHMFRTILFSDVRSELARVRAPTLILQASQDAFVPKAVATYMQAQIPDAQLHVLSGAGGHFPHLGAPTAVLTAIQDFLF